MLRIMAILHAINCMIFRGRDSKAMHFFDVVVRVENIFRMDFTRKAPTPL